MAKPTVQYDATNGSDTAPTGNDGSGTNGDLSGTTLTLNETVDFTGVADDDTDYLWYEGNAGDRHLFQITAFNPSVGACTSITVAESGTTRTAKNWAVNGERKTLNNDTSNRDWNDMSAGWTFEFQAGTYDTPVTIAPATGDGTNGGVAFVAASGASPTIRMTANLHHFTGLAGLILRGLTLTTNSGTKTLTYAVRTGEDKATIIMDNCVVDSLQKGIVSFWNGFITCYNTHFKNMVGEVVDHDTLPSSLIFVNCVFSGAGGAAIDYSGFTATSYDVSIVCVNCVFHNNTGDAINTDAGGYAQYAFVGCVFDGNSDAIDVNTGTASEHFSLLSIANIFSNNGAYGVRGKSVLDAMPIISDQNGYYSNTSGHRSNLTAGANSSDLSADPYVDRTNDDFNINSTASGGQTLRDKTLTMHAP